MTPTSPQTDGTLELAEMLYQALMARVEPDLLVENLAGLDAKYAGETAEDKVARFTRYEVAVKKVDAEFKEIMGQAAAAERKDWRNKQHSSEQAERTAEETGALQTIEHSFT